MTVTTSITFDNLTPAQAQEIADFVQATIIEGLRPVYHAIDPVVQTFAPPPPPVGNSPAPVPAVTSNNPPPPPPVGNVPSVPVPSVAPSVPAPAATVSIDNRGVPYHPDHHSGTAEKPGTNDDGSWKKRRGHDKDALKAYEAPYLKAAAGNPQVAAAPAAVTPPTHGTAPSVTGASGGNTHVPPPPPPPPPPAAPADPVTTQDFETLWTKLVAAGYATPALEQWLIAEYGGHPVHSDVFKLDPTKRLTAYNFLKRYDVAAAA